MADEDKTPATSEGGEGGGDDESSASNDNANDNIPARLSVREIYEQEAAKAAAAADEGGDDDGKTDDVTPPDGGEDDGASDKPDGEGDDGATADADKGEDETPKGDEEPKGDEPAGDGAPETTPAETAKAELDALLETYNDPEVLNAALTRAGVEKVSELPAVKEIIGRISQSVRDQTKAEIEKAAREAAQIADATREGKSAKGKLVSAIKGATEALESDDPNAVVELPTEESVEKAFEDYADAAVGEYHTRAWNVLSDTLYTLPEFGGDLPDGYDGPPVPELTDEQKNLLAAVKGENANTWLAAHLTVQRDVLWNWAQAHGEADAKAAFEQEKIQIQAAHSNEVKRIQKEHEKALADARADERAKAIEDAANGKLPVKTPSKRPATTERDPDENKPKAGASIREVHAWAKEQAEAERTGSSV